MKFVLLFTVTLLITRSHGRNSCFSRGEVAKLRYERNAAKCLNATEQLVMVPVPEGYDYVFPKMVKVKQCHGMMCLGMNIGCLATKTKTRSVKVEAMMENDFQKQCLKVNITEHVHCGCGCTLSEEQCKEGKVLDEQRCKCVCPEKKESECKAKGSHFMWNSERCMCVCTPSTCPLNEMKDQKTCSCMPDLE